MTDDAGTAGPQAPQGPVLRLTAQSFPPETSWNGSHDLPVTRQQVLKCAVSLGLQSVQLRADKPEHAVWFSSYKALAVRCAFDFTQPELCRHPMLDQLEPSEKTNVAFWAGMTLAALVADRHLGIARLIHLEFLVRSGLLPPPTGQRPDFAGQDEEGRWHAIEAKARSKYPALRDRQDWKEQARFGGSVPAINGMAVTTTSYAFTRLAQSVTVDLVDPPAEPAPPGEGELRISDDTIRAKYYGPLFDWLVQQKTLVPVGPLLLAPRPIAIDPIDGDYLYLGLTGEAVHALKAGKLPPRLEPVSRAGLYVGSDGVGVLTAGECRLGG